MKKLITVILIMLSSIAVYAQKNDVGIFAGSSYYTGDLNPGTPFKNISPAIGAFYRHNFTNRLAIKVGYTTTKLKSDDFQRNRSLSFKTNLNEVSAQFEVNFYEFGIDGEDNRVSPYIFGGMGESWFRVKEISGIKGVGQSRSITNFPFGLGIKYNPIENVSVGLEWGLRKTTGSDADKIDNVYNPGERISDATDWYINQT
jgi:hypothetical protein